MSDDTEGAAPSPYSANLYSPEANNSWSHLIQLIPDGSRVLDIGCSSGNFGAALQELKDCAVIGIDINADDVALAQQKLTEAYVVDVTQPDALRGLGTFDVVLVADVLEHLMDPRSALKQIDGALREGGLLVFSIPHMGYLSVRLDLLAGEFAYNDLGLLDRTHVHFYDRVEIHDMLATAGFQVTVESPVIAHEPERWVAERLATLGLAPSAEFFRLLDHTEAHVYQYVGVAERRGDLPSSTRPQHEELSPPDAISQRADRLLGENDALTSENERLRTELLGLEQTVVPEFWRVTAELRDLRGASEARIAELTSRNLALAAEKSMLTEIVSALRAQVERQNADWDAALSALPPRIRRRVEASPDASDAAGS
jgi:2-polyprenyl-3-methyl-5-hydroxy-6-metoxy-1,4-benzoquinol methylase